ncbi:helix-turn-helix domain-containing protein [Paracoccus saliphilus]|uniref:Helix-turn-helix domain-containing protein n=1 Tax=Paracoccus saliphilus TaxID=405559 RepID=A0AA46A7G1_9RHOB|nr:helix-turn-helix domain-containing protein [Paracoccus saliphilus]WCR04819.1 helix-turn-helix domain-containing protein [Paracoccus saliphilus]SIT12968.1 transcriptional regulator, ArsR family [Paracoccus saliphilus]
MDRHLEPIFSAISNPTRRAILDFLLRNDGASRAEIEAELDLNQNTLTGHLRTLANSSVVISMGNITRPRYYVNPTAFRIMNEQWIRKFVESEGCEDELPIFSDEQSIKRHYTIYIRATPRIVWIQMTDDRRTKLWLQLELSTETVEKSIKFKTGDAVAFTGRITKNNTNREFSYEIDTSDIKDIQEQKISPNIVWKFRPIGDYATKLEISLECPETNNDLLRLFFNRWPEALSKLKTLSETGTRFWISPLDASN